MKPEEILTEYMQLRPDAPVPEDPMVLIQSLFGIIHARQAEVAEWRARLSKDSHNSSKPPSSDGLEKKPTSLRKASGRKPGGQKGHAGHTLEFVLPNTVIEHSPPDYGDACGASLGGCEASLSNVDRSLISRRSSWRGSNIG
jgi:transposase